MTKSYLLQNKTGQYYAAVMTTNTGKRRVVWVEDITLAKKFTSKWGVMAQMLKLDNDYEMLAYKHVPFRIEKIYIP